MTTETDAEKDKHSEWYLRLLDEAEIVDSRYPIQGMLVYRRWGFHIIREMQRYLEKLLEEDGHEPVLFPVLIPEDILGKESEHVKGFEDQVFWVTHAGQNKLERRMALRPTSETSMYELFPLWIRSHTDLPLKVHQSVTVYRYETKHTRPLIRGREFLWNEGHTAFRSLEDAEKNIREIEEIYGKLINDLLCLPYQINKRPDWDKFPGALYTVAFETIMPNGRTLQVATAHNLGQNFSKVFNIRFENEKGEHEYVWQTSYGPGFGRLLAAVISVHGDETGLILPPKISPIQVVIVPILFKDTKDEEILDYAGKVRDTLARKGVRVHLDSSEKRPGEKYFYWEMKGVPLRIEAGPKDLKENKVMVVRRDTKEKKQVEFGELSKTVPQLFMEIEANIRKTAQEKFDKRLYTAKNTSELKKHVGEGIVTTGWCIKKECAPSIESLGTILEIDESAADKCVCVVCGKPGKRIRVAKTY